ncbi:fructose-specific PTS transporter subunit EIIC [Streptomyces sp. IMTB 2501]|uniref:fructose-specific PTS transporter subunit EIIC n=1 Tax=Streptomyces sp. IMTB 2501 TaxID=1776340 RepID=UPI0009A167AA|nr:fructose-specific PTS transporter subunit EIIC [Streptomyces sp. IMTB 2501]
MTSPAGPPSTGGRDDEGRQLKLLAVTACPTGIAHTYMAAEKLAQAAASRGIEMKVETQGSIGAENVLDDNDVRSADGVIVAADKDVDLSRFAGKRVLAVGVAEGIHHPEQLIERVRSAPVHAPGAADGGAAAAPGGGGKERGPVYKALMNGVSYMIPFVVVGGLLIAVSLALGGHATSKGFVIPDGTFWAHVNAIGGIGFQLMIPILSGYIAYAIADRPALVPGMIGGWIANTGDLYDSKAGAGFIGAIVTGFLAGYLVLWIKKIRVPKFVQPIMPIIVIPIVATTALGLFFIYVIGKPISWVFEHLTSWLGGMTGTSAILLGAILGLMIAFDMGGPVNKTAFLFGAGLIASGNQTVMGMCAAAIPVMPLGQGLATLIRRRLYTEQERETGLAALFMGCFGISEGAIPFAAARPAQVIPANMLGGAVAGAVAGLAGVKDAVPHGGPIVAVLGAVSGVPMFFVAVVIGSVVTSLATVALVDVSGLRGRRVAVAGAVPALSGAGSGVVGNGFPPAPPVQASSSGPGGPRGGSAPAAAVGSSSEGASASSETAGSRSESAGTSSETPGSRSESAGTSSETPGSRSESAHTSPETTGSRSENAGTSSEAVGSSSVSANTPSEAASSSTESAGTSSAAASSLLESASTSAEAASSSAESGGTSSGVVVPGQAAAAGSGAVLVSAGREAAAEGGRPEVLSGYLSGRTVKVGLGAGDKGAAIREMAELLSRSGRVGDVDELVAVALRREEQGTTGLGEEIAIPHAKTDAVTAPVVGFARSAEGVEWGSLDGTKARLVFMIAVPEAAAGDEHLRILALLSRKLMDAGFRERLLAAPDERAVLDVLGEVG